MVITGADEIKEEEVRDAAGITPNSILNPYKVNEAVQKIKDLYKSKGYFNTQVNGQISSSDDGKSEVRFTIDEGEKITVEEINNKEVEIDNTEIKNEIDNTGVEIDNTGVEISYNFV